MNTGDLEDIRRQFEAAKDAGDWDRAAELSQRIVDEELAIQASTPASAQISQGALLITLYHGTTVDWTKLLSEGLLPKTREQIVTEALMHAETILGHLPEGAEAVAKEEAARYRRKNPVGTWFSSTKEVAVFYAPFGHGGEAVSEVLSAVLLMEGVYKSILEMRDIVAVGSKSMKCYIVTVQIPVDWVADVTLRDKENRARLLAGVGAPEVRVLKSVPSSYILEIEEFYHTLPGYEKTERGFLQIGSSVDSVPVTVWRA